MFLKPVNVWDDFPLKSPISYASNVVGDDELLVMFLGL